MLAMSEQQRIGKLQMLLLRFRYFKLFFSSNSMENKETGEEKI